MGGVYFRKGRGCCASTGSVISQHLHRCSPPFNSPVEDGGVFRIGDRNPLSNTLYLKDREGVSNADRRGRGGTLCCVVFLCMCVCVCVCVMFCCVCVGVVLLCVMCHVSCVAWYVQAEPRTPHETEWDAICSKFFSISRCTSKAKPCVVK